MPKLLVWIFVKQRLTYFDLLALFVGLAVGGWVGAAVTAALFFIGAFAEAWHKDRGV